MCYSTCCQLVDAPRTVSKLFYYYHRGSHLLHPGLVGSYCSQSSRYTTATTASRLLELDPVIKAAKKAKDNGSTRFCMGAAWRDMEGRKRSFDRILAMVREVRGMGMEVCTTLGMLNPDQAKQLKEA